MKVFIRSAVIASVCALGFGTMPAPAADKVTLNAEVASSVKAPFEQFIGIYQKTHPNVTIVAKYLGGSVIQGDVESDNTKRDGLYQTAEQTIVADAPLLFLYQRTSWWLVKPYVKGLTITPIDYYMGDFYPSTIQIAQH